MRINFSLLLFALFLFVYCSNNSNETKPPYDLVIGEGFENPLGYYDAETSFSWKLPVTEKVKSQSAYRIVAASDPGLLPDYADLWDTERVNSDQSVWVKYKGTPLTSRQKVYWQVMFWDQDGSPSDWSEVATFELGLLNNEDWQSEWIYLQPEEKLDKHFIYKPQYLRKDFTLSDNIEQARLYITSKGIFEAEINGKKVGEDVMTPGWTPLLAPVLAKYGEAELMYSILFKETYPSWFYSINQGATTMWERWNSYSHKDGFGDAGMNSFNHYAYGAIGKG
jgi:alpha-L-rhamnosidase